MPGAIVDKVVIAPSQLWLFLYLDRLLEIMTHRIFKPWYHLDWVFRLTKMYHEQKRCSNITYSFIGKILQNKKRDMQNKNHRNAEREVVTKPEDDFDEKGSFKSPQIFIDQLLKLEGSHFNDWDMLSEASTIVAAVSLRIESQNPLRQLL